MKEDSLRQLLDGSGRIENGAEFLLDSGLLFEINRRILHPLGLALCALRQTDTDGSVTFSMCNYLVDQRMAEEGILYNDQALEIGENALLKFMEEFGYGKMLERQRLMGFVVQRSGRKIESDEF